MNSSSLKLLAVVLAAVAMLAGAAGVHAQEPIKLGITPVGVEGSHFTLTLAPGERRELTVQLANHGAGPVRARTYAADVYTIVNGGFGARLDGEPTSGATTWLAYPPATLEIAPSMGINRPFTVTAPAAATPGEYITSLVIQNADPVQGPAGGIQFQQVNRQAIALSITVPGPRAPGLQIGSVTHKTVADTSVVAVAVKNTGNARLKPAGEFVLLNAAGKEVSRHPIAMDSVYAGTETLVEVPFDQRLNPGEYTVSLSLAAPEGAAAASGPLPVRVPRPEADAAAQPAAVPPRATIDQGAAAVAPGAGAWLWILAGVAGAGVMAGVAFSVGRRRRRAPAASEVPSWWMTADPSAGRRGRR